MDSLTGIKLFTTPPFGIGGNSAVPPAAALLTSELGLASNGLFGGPSTIVSLSGLSQLLSATSIFQDQMQALQPGTATSGGGRNFGTDFASLAAEAQYFVDAFNGLQRYIAGINASSGLFGGPVSGGSTLTAALDAQAKAGYANGNSPLTSLSQLGIQFQPSPIPGLGGSLSIDLEILQSAFNRDAAGAFSLLSSVADAFGSLASSQSAMLTTLAQNTASIGLLETNLLFGGQTSGSGLASLLAFGLLGNATNRQQTIVALSEYNLVSSLLA